MIFEQQSLWNYPVQTYGASDFRDGKRAKMSALQENKKGLKTKKGNKHVAVCFSKLLDYSKAFPKKLDPNTCSAKMLKVFSVLTEAGGLPQSSIIYGSAGMTVNGNYSTLSIPMLSVTQSSAQYHKIGKEYTSLADVLEKKVDDKYYLSQEQMKKILLNCNR